MELAILIVLTAATTVGIAMVSGAAAKKVAATESRLDRMLRPIARKVGATFTKGGLPSRPKMRYTTHDGIAVHVRLFTTKDAEHAVYELTVPPPGVGVFALHPLMLDVLHKDLTGVLGKDIVVGEPELDKAFKIKGPDEGMVRRVWTLPFARTVATRFTLTRFKSDGSKLSLEHIIQAESQVADHLELGLQIARCDAYGVQALRELPEARLVPDARGLLQAEVPGPSRVVVGPQRHDNVMRTRVEIAAALQVPEDTRRRIESLGAVVETSTEATRIVWPSIEADRQRLLGAVEILRQLSSGTSLGAFR